MKRNQETKRKVRDQTGVVNIRPSHSHMATVVKKFAQPSWGHDESKCSLPESHQPTGIHLFFSTNQHVFVSTIFFSDTSAAVGTKNLKLLKKDSLIWSPYLKWIWLNLHQILMLSMYFHLKHNLYTCVVVKCSSVFTWEEKFEQSLTTHGDHPGHPAALRAEASLMCNTPWPQQAGRALTPNWSLLHGNFIPPPLFPEAWTTQRWYGRCWIFSPKLN